MRLIVIADDLTGGAEIAGIGWRFGMNVGLIVDNSPLWGDETCQMLVVVTNTRSETKEKAIEITKQLATNFKVRFAKDDVRFFKKIDSAMRGYIIAETCETLKVFGFRKALLIPQNPSKGRIIEDGRYLIDGLPINKTPFRYDPEFPISSADVCGKILIGSKLLKVSNTTDNGIMVAEASSKDDIKSQIEKADEETLIVGGADCFEEMIRRLGFVFSKSLDGQKRSTKEQDNIFLGLRHTLIVQGSTQSKPPPAGIPSTLMPDEVMHGAECDKWKQDALKTYRLNDTLALTIKHDEIDSSLATIVKSQMSSVTSFIIQECKPQTVIIEGGATAFNIIKIMKWKSFCVTYEYAPGIVAITPYPINDYSPTLILKPGSYAWGDIRYTITNND